MLEKPKLADEKVSACLQVAFALHVVQLEFLPLGADPNTFTYRAMAADENAYFVKLRRGAFDEISVALPKFLSTRGILEIISPLETHNGKLCAPLDPFNVIVYPFVNGKNGYERELSEAQWRALGTALAKIHRAELPFALARQIHRETFSAEWRERVKRYIAQVDGLNSNDRVVQESAAFLKMKRAEILELVARAEQLAHALETQPLEFVLCHADLHAGNVLLDENGALYLVDWDAPMLAPQERDLMSIGGGLFGAARSAEQEQALFYRGYGETMLNHAALAYYRFERIIQDIAVEWEQILSPDVSEPDRARELYFLKSNFAPNGTIELAYRAAQSV